MITGPLLILILLIAIVFIVLGTIMGTLLEKSGAAIKLAEMV
jgi:H+/gluconate symporter-like permease